MPSYKPRRFVKARLPVARPRRFRRGLMGGRVRRRMAFNPTPTFVETYSNGSIPVNAVAPGQFSLRVSDIPQIADYIALYRQYRINWVKVTLIPDYNTASADINAVQYNTTLPTNAFGLARIAWAINDTPNLPDPVSEADVLSDNGAKVKAIGTRWSCSFKPRPDKFTGTSTGDAGVAVREKYNQWLSFAELSGNNPLHRGVSYCITMPNFTPPGGDAVQLKFNVYFKVSFSLRDPK